MRYRRKDHVVWWRLGTIVKHCLDSHCLIILQLVFHIFDRTTRRIQNRWWVQFCLFMYTLRALEEHLPLLQLWIYGVETSRIEAHSLPLFETTGMLVIILGNSIVWLLMLRRRHSHLALRTCLMIRSGCLRTFILRDC